VLLLLCPHTGKTTTVREFCEMAFKHAGMPIKWEGSGINEVRQWRVFSCSSLFT
jgi:GDP-D-mannose dehydratase